MSSSVQEKRTKETRGYSWWGWRRSRSSRETTPAPETTMMNIDSTKGGEIETKEQSSAVPIEPPSTKIDIPGNVLEITVCIIFIARYHKQ